MESETQIQLLKKAQRHTLLTHLSRHQYQIEVKRQAKLKSAGKIFAKSLLLGFVCNLGITGWYWLDYDLNIWDPKLTKYITDRLG
jgi:hypothetical protein